jgi:hypothetical protein
MEPGSFPFEDLGHIPAHDGGEGNSESEEKNDLEDFVGFHWRGWWMRRQYRKFISAGVVNVRPKTVKRA